MRNWFFELGKRIIAYSFLGVLFLIWVFIKKQKKDLVWGPVPIINNKYWSDAMRKGGWSSTTLMHSYYSINKPEDFDLYFDDLMFSWIWPQVCRKALGPYFAFLYILRNAKVVHIPFSGGPLERTPIWKIESHLLRWAGIRTVIIPYGSDIYIYSFIIDPSIRNGLLLSYPDAAKNEKQISERVQYWAKHGDVILGGFTVDGVGRWDVPVGNMICIDTNEWLPKKKYSSCDGVEGTVRVLHAANHRGVKGTEYLIWAVEELKAEGLKIDLIFVEGVRNDQIRRLMQETDILADQYVLVGYGLAAIEGMASGLPVTANLEHEAYTRIFRRYSFLNECPILSTSPETIKKNLRILITRPKLREQLGRAGRQYVEKYHSYETAQFLFGSIYDKLLEHKNIDLMNLFHPLKSEYNRRKPEVQRPLIENRLPISKGEIC